MTRRNDMPDVATGEGNLVGKRGSKNDLLPGQSGALPHSPDGGEAVDEYSVTEEVWRLDAERLGRNALMRKYPKAFSSFKAMKDRERKGIAEVDPEFETFKPFFNHMGPPHAPGDTLDRIDNNNPRYGPGLCQWAPKKQQARNRRNTLKSIDKRSGRTKPLVQIAEELGVPITRVRQQHRQGWSLQELEAQQREPGAVGAWPWPLADKQHEAWEREYAKNRTHFRGAGYEFRYEFAHRALANRRKELEEEIETTWLKYAGYPSMETAFDHHDEWEPADVISRMPPDIRGRYEQAQQELVKVTVLFEPLTISYRDLDREHASVRRDQRPRRAGMRSSPSEDVGGLE